MYKMCMVFMRWLLTYLDIAVRLGSLLDTSSVLTIELGNETTKVYSILWLFLCLHSFRIVYAYIV